MSKCSPLGRIEAGYVEFLIISERTSDDPAQLSQLYSILESNRPIEVSFVYFIPRLVCSNCDGIATSNASLECDSPGQRHFGRIHWPSENNNQKNTKSSP